MSWPLGTVSEIAEIISGYAFKSEWFGDGSNKVIRIGDLQDGRIQLDSALCVDAKINNVSSQFKIQPKDILMALSGATVGKIAIAQECDAGAYINQRVAIIRGKTPEAAEFLKYVFSGALQEKLLLSAGGAAQPNLSPKSLALMEIPLPPLAEQKRIAAILDKADAIRRKRQQAIKLADDFLRSVFLDMFGDPVSNPKGWSIDYLSNLGSFKNGLNYGKEEEGTSISCLGVGDFKALDRIEGICTLSNIQLNIAPAEDYLLRDGDLVFVRSNGNKALVGRCIAVYPRGALLTFSGFCIRFRIFDEKISTDYLNYLFRMPSVKHEMLKGGQGANIQNINQKKLSEIVIPIPSKELLNKFSEIVKAFKSTETKKHINSDQILNLLSSVGQQAFSGNL